MSTDIQQLNKPVLVKRPAGEGRVTIGDILQAFRETKGQMQHLEKLILDYEAKTEKKPCNIS